MSSSPISPPLKEKAKYGECTGEKASKIINVINAVEIQIININIDKLKKNT